MGSINIANAAGRDAVVNTESVSVSQTARWLDSQSRQASLSRILKSTIDCDMEALEQKFGDPDRVGQALIEDDPEIDLEVVGSTLREVSRVYLDSERRMAHRIQVWEIVRNPDGSERARRPRQQAPPNVSAETPLRWSGKFIAKEEACRRFVFVSKLQLTHINGLTYDFLYDMARELESKNSLLLLGAGPKSNQPLVLRRGGTPYRGFLEGRTREGKYCLILHLSNLELKAPQESQ